jgi:acyl-CoA synthetase (NDP forming)
MQLEQIPSITGSILLPFDATVDLLSRAGFPIIPNYFVDSISDCRQVIDRVGFPIVAKLTSEKSPHKSDIGGVILGINSFDHLIGAYEELQQKRDHLDPSGKIVIQPMVSKGIEMIVGVTFDPQLGSILMVGSGGIFTEVLNDVSFGMIPIRRIDAWRMINTLKIYPLLEGVRGQKKADIPAMVEIMLSLSKLIEEKPEIYEVDCNPVIVGEHGAIIVDARIGRKQ